MLQNEKEKYGFISLLKDSYRQWWSRVFDLQV